MAEVITHPRTFEFSALDIAAQPHPEKCYEKLFKTATKLKLRIKILGQEWGQLSRLRWEKDENGNVISISGDIYRFTNIDQNAAWFDRDKGEEADDSLLKEVSIPKSLSPNTKIIHWYFTIENHILVFVSKNGKATLSAKQAEAFFARIMDAAAKEVSGVEYVDVTTCKSPDAIDKIFKKKTVSRLEIDLRKPNLDDPAEAFKKINETMEKENSRRWTETLTANENDTLKESTRIEELLHASRRLGSAQAITYDESGEKEEIDTKEHPITEREVYDPNRKQAVLSFVAGVATTLIAAVLSGKNKK